MQSLSLQSLFLFWVLGNTVFMTAAAFYRIGCMHAADRIYRRGWRVFYGSLVLGLVLSTICGGIVGFGGALTAAFLALFCTIAVG